MSDKRKKRLTVKLKDLYYSTDLASCMIVCPSIVTMVFSFMFTLADVASQPYVHSVSYAVHHLPLLQCSTDQSRATQVSRIGPDSDLLVGGTE